MRTRAQLPRRHYQTTWVRTGILYDRQSFISKRDKLVSVSRVSFILLNDSTG